MSNWLDPDWLKPIIPSHVSLARIIDSGHRIQSKFVWFRRPLLEASGGETQLFFQENFWEKFLFLLDGYGLQELFGSRGWLALEWRGDHRGCVYSVAQSCLTVCNPMDCSPPGSSAHGDTPGKSTGVGARVKDNELQCQCRATDLGIF